MNTSALGQHESEARPWPFLGVPERSSKPRDRGLTLARDPGLGARSLDISLETCAPFVDVLKFRNVTPALFPLSQLRDKLALLHSHQIAGMTGGVLLEWAFANRMVDRVIDAAAEYGFAMMEVSDGIIPIPDNEQDQLARKVRSAGLRLVMEWGRKWPDGMASPETVAQAVQTRVDMGAELVVIEESELNLMFAQEPEQLESWLSKFEAMVDPRQVTYEVPQRNHQALLIRHFGPDVNIGPNLDLDEVLWLEPMRRGLGKEVGYAALTPGGEDD
ncbi:MAG: phosphosulfolactate synthase [Marmoricola sp.]|jgi:phosphosulfolactate synthase|nr:phosphosulfolactate synthase [Marmoricola sp.]